MSKVYVFELRQVVYIGESLTGDSSIREVQAYQTSQVPKVPKSVVRDVCTAEMKTLETVESSQMLQGLVANTCVLKVQVLEVCESTKMGGTFVAYRRPVKPRGFQVSQRTDMAQVIIICHSPSEVDINDLLEILASQKLPEPSRTGRLGVGLIYSRLVVLVVVPYAAADLEQPLDRFPLLSGAASFNTEPNRTYSHQHEHCAKAELKPESPESGFPHTLIRHVTMVPFARSTDLPTNKLATRTLNLGKVYIPGNNIHLTPTYPTTDGVVVQLPIVALSFACRVQLHEPPVDSVHTGLR